MTVQPAATRPNGSGRKATDRLALSKAQAAEALGGISVDSFERHVMPHLRVVRIGESRHARVVIPVAELERYLEQNAALPVGGSA